MPQKIDIGRGRLLRAPDKMYRYRVELDLTVENEDGEEEEVSIEEEVTSQQGSARSEFTKDYFMDLIENHGYDPAQVTELDGRVIQETEIIRGEKTEPGVNA